MVAMSPTTTQPVVRQNLSAVSNQVENVIFRLQLVRVNTPHNYALGF